MKKRPYTTLGVLYIITTLLLLAILTESCASRCKQQRRYCLTNIHL
jgi:hypothetical protein